MSQAALQVKRIFFRFVRGRSVQAKASRPGHQMRVARGTHFSPAVNRFTPVRVGWGG